MYRRPALASECFAHRLWNQLASLIERRILNSNGNFCEIAKLLSCVDPNSSVRTYICDWPLQSFQPSNLRLVSHYSSHYICEPQISDFN